MVDKREGQQEGFAELILVDEKLRSANQKMAILESVPAGTKIRLSELKLINDDLVAVRDTLNRGILTKTYGNQEQYRIQDFKGALKRFDALKQLRKRDVVLTDEQAPVHIVASLPVEASPVSDSRQGVLMNVEVDHEKKAEGEKVLEGETKKPLLEVVKELRHLRGQIRRLEAKLTLEFDPDALDRLAEENETLESVSQTPDEAVLKDSWVQLETIRDEMMRLAKAIRNHPDFYNLDAVAVEDIAKTYGDLVSALNGCELVLTAFDPKGKKEEEKKSPEPQTPMEFIDAAEEINGEINSLMAEVLQTRHKQDKNLIIKDYQKLQVLTSKLERLVRLFGGKQLSLTHAEIEDFEELIAKAQGFIDGCDALLRMYGQRFAVLFPMKPGDKALPFTDEPAAIEAPVVSPVGPIEPPGPPKPPDEPPTGHSPEHPEHDETPSAMRPFLHFIRGKGFAGVPESWVNTERWREVRAEQVAAAIFRYIEIVVLRGDAKGDSIYIKNLNILGTKIPGLGEHETILDVVKGFIAAGIEFNQSDKAKADAFNEIGSVMLEDLAQLQLVFDRGNAVKQREEDGKALHDWFMTDEAKMSVLDWRRISIIGRKYAVDAEDGHEVLSFAEKIIYALQAHLFVDQVTYVPKAVMDVSLKEGEEPQFIYNVHQKSEIGIFPLAAEQNDANWFNVVRNLIQKEIGAATPENRPIWIRWQEENPREVNETLSEYADRLSDSMRKYFTNKILGEGGSRANPTPDSELGRQRASGRAAQEKEYLSKAETDQRLEGYIPEMAAVNILEFSLFPATSEGETLSGEVAVFDIMDEEVSDTNAILQHIDELFSIDLSKRVNKPQKIKKMRLRRVYSPEEVAAGALPKRAPNIEGFPVLKVPKSKSTSIFFMARVIRPSTYALGLTYSDQKASGSGFIADKAIGKVYSCLMDQLSAYFAIPEGEREGIDLREQLLLVKNQTEMSNIKFDDFLRLAEQNPEWFDLIHYGYERYMTLVKGMGDLSKISSTDVLSGAAYAAASAAVIREQFAPALRSFGDYAHTRKTDWGFVDNSISWKNKEDWNRYRVVEEWYLRQCNLCDETNPPTPYEEITFPEAIKGIATAPYINMVLKATVRPTRDYSWHDVMDQKETHKGKIVRWFSRAENAYYIPDEKRGFPMDAFEKSVVLNSQEDALTIADKLHFGRAIIVALSLSSRGGFSLSDRQALKVALSRESAVRLEELKKHPLYKLLTGGANLVESVRIFTDKQVEAIMNEAEIAGGVFALLRDAEEFLKNTAPPR